MSCDDHWLILSRKLCSNLFLFKQMKRIGFKIEQILPPAEHIEKRWESILERILKEKSHPTTIKLSKENPSDKAIQTRSTFHFEAPIPKLERYNNSFVPKTLRALREHNKPKQQSVKSVSIIQNESNNKIACSLCGRYYMKRGMKVHQRSCQTKNSTQSADPEI